MEDCVCVSPAFTQTGLSQDAVLTGDGRLRQVKAALFSTLRTLGMCFTEKA